MRLSTRKLRNMNRADAIKKGNFFKKKLSSSSKGWRDRYCFMTAADYPESKRDEIRACHVWQGFKEKTTAHGIPHIDQSRGTEIFVLLMVNFATESS